jgi:succinoglycan biosynthesis protein ExoA
MASYDEIRTWPDVSVVMAVRDEEPHLPDALDAVRAQEYPGALEVVVAVAPSRDRTLELARAAAADDARVRVVDNPKAVTPSGLNTAFAHTTGQVIVRVDGHACLPAGYVRRAVELLEETGAANVGGVMAAEGHTPFERAVAAAMSSRFGTGDARFHYGGEPGPVDTVYLGVFRREVLEKTGGYDESFVRAQDAELNHRIREMGGVVYFHPDLRVSYRPRGSWRALTRQYFHYGRWRRVVVRTHPGSVAWRQLVPPAALAGNVAGVALGVAGGVGGRFASGVAGTRVAWLGRLGLAAPVVYLAAVAAGSAAAGRDLPRRSAVWLPLVFVTMHMAWAWGFVTSPRDLGAQGMQSVREASSARRPAVD